MTFFFTDRKLKIFTDGILFSRAEILIGFLFCFFHYFKAFFWSKYDFLQCPPRFFKTSRFSDQNNIFYMFFCAFFRRFFTQLQKFSFFFVTAFLTCFHYLEGFLGRPLKYIYFLIEKTSLEPSKSVILKLKYWTHHPSHYPFSKNYKSITSYMADHHWW